MTDSLDELEAKFPEASLVTLKSGSPKMVVEWCRNDGVISVAWIDQAGVPHRDAFHPDALVPEPAFDQRKTA